MTDAVVDTHVLLWAISRPDKLTRAARRWVDEAAAGKRTIRIPTIVLVEIALLEEARRPVAPLAQVLRKIEGSTGLAVVPLDVDDARSFPDLPAHLDPFDRMIAATAVARSLPLLTADERLHELPQLRCIWD